MKYSRQEVFITGGIGYVGGRLVPEWLRRGHIVRVLVGSGSEKKLPQGCAVTVGDVLDSKTFITTVSSRTTFVHLVGVPRPAPWKGPQFRAVNLPSLRTSLLAAQAAQTRHVVYISVAHPASVMKAYVQVRSQCETSIRASGLVATILRP